MWRGEVVVGRDKYSQREYYKIIINGGQPRVDKVEACTCIFKNTNFVAN